MPGFVDHITGLRPIVRPQTSSADIKLMAVGALAAKPNRSVTGGIAKLICALHRALPGAAVSGRGAKQAGLCGCG